MKIIVNGKEHNLNNELITLDDLLMELNINLGTVVAELDGEIIVKDQFERTVLKEGTILELINIVGGG